MKVYLASSWRNDLQPAVHKRLRDAGHLVYDFRHPTPTNDGFHWSEIDPGWRHWTAAMFVQALQSEPARRGLRFDFEAMQQCDALVMLQPCGRSAHLELGWAIGAAKKTAVLLAEGQEPELMLRLADHLCLTVDEVLEVLR